jgi:small subunit ribosomal protein S4e
VPKNWPIHRKGTAYVVRPNFSESHGIPILIILRDILKVAHSRKEAKKAINHKFILVNQKEVEDEKNAMVLFDTISLVPSKKHYRLELSSNGKFQLEEIKESEIGKKVAKVMDKKILKGKKTQLNLSDGRNLLSDEKCNMNDSVIINVKEKKIEKCLPLKEKSNVVVFQGKHAGKRGVVKKVDSERKMVSISEKEGSIKVLIKQVIAIE